MKIVTSFFAAFLLLAISSAIGAPIYVDLTGSLNPVTGQPNLHVLASLQSDAIDQNSLTSIGQYKIDSLKIEYTPYTSNIMTILTADPSTATAYLYPSALGSQGSLRFAGSFASGSSWSPGGIQALTYDLGLSFLQIQNDQLSSILQPLQLTSATVSIIDPIGTYSNNLLNASIQVTSVPEPSEYMLMLMGFGLTGFIAARRKKAV